MNCRIYFHDGQPLDLPEQLPLCHGFSSSPHSYVQLLLQRVTTAAADVRVDLLRVGQLVEPLKILPLVKGEAPLNL